MDQHTDYNRQPRDQHKSTHPPQIADRYGRHILLFIETRHLLLHQGQPFFGVFQYETAANDDKNANEQSYQPHETDPDRRLMTQLYLRLPKAPL